MDITRYRGFHRGQRIVVVGCGPTTKALVDKYGEPLCPSIAVNDAGQWLRPTYLVVVDGLYRLAYRWDGVLETDCHACFIYARRPDNIQALREKGQLVVPFFLARPKRALEPTADGHLSFFLDTPWVATSLAIYMGAQAIGFMGVDHNDDTHTLAPHRARIRQGYHDLMWHWKERRGIDFYRLSEDSALPYEYVSYEDFARAV